MKITFVLDKQTIRRTDSNTVVAGSRDYLYAHFALASPDWIAPITAIFGNKTVILNDDGDCKVPWEVIEHPGEFSVSAFCVSVHTAQGVMVPVEETPYDPGETPPDPSPDVYTQLTQMVQDALDTANSVREDANAGEFNGAPGPVGPYYEPDVSDAGDISWENNGGLPNPPTKNIKGPKGDAATIEIAGTETGNPGTDASVVNEGTKGDAKFRFTIPRGDEGKAATIEVGDVTASDPGSEPRVTNSGTENAAVLDFVLPRGQTGPTGQAATVEVESTVTGEPGTQASVENVGTTGAAKLKFTIPRGDTGQNGVTPTLSAGNVETLEPDQPATASVTGEGPAYQINLGIPRGQTGAQGTPGQDGQTPTIAVGTVTTLDPGQDATAEITGETPDLVLSLGIPQGQPGQEGVQLNDSAINTTEAWSSKKIVDTFCPPFSVSGNPVTCNPVEDYPLGAVVTLEPKQAGSGDPSPENVRPISGWGKVTVNVRGKNLIGNFGEETRIVAGVTWTVENDRISAQGETGESFSSTCDGLFNITLPTPPASYSLSYKVTGNNIDLVCAFYKSDKTVLAYLDNNKSYTLTEHNVYVRIYAQVSPNKVVNGTISDIQFEVGPTPTPYEPYQLGTTATISLPEAIYGGTVDAVTGMGEKTWEFVEFDGTEIWNITLSATTTTTTIFNAPATAEKLPLTGTSPVTQMCNVAAWKVFNWSGNYPWTISGSQYNGNIFISVPNDVASTVEEWKSYLAAQAAAGTPVQVAYKLATPESIQATGNQALPAVAGLNTLYTDGDSLAVSGRQDLLYTLQTMRAQTQNLNRFIAEGGTT